MKNPGSGNKTIRKTITSKIKGGETYSGIKNYCEAQLKIRLLLIHGKFTTRSTSFN
jgi:hypothetical protein